MRGRKPKPLVLKRKDAAQLDELLDERSLPHHVAQRARILLACAKQERVVQVAAKVEFDPATIWRVCERYRQGGLQAALYDAPRAGRPRVFFLSYTEED